MKNGQLIAQLQEHGRDEEVTIIVETLRPWLEGLLEHTTLTPEGVKQVLAVLPSAIKIRIIDVGRDSDRFTARTAIYS